MHNTKGHLPLLKYSPFDFRPGPFNKHITYLSSVCFKDFPSWTLVNIYP